jgi:signal transduction histidine kinase
VLVQAIAEAHGGSVAVESSAEEGTTFTIDIFRDAREVDRKRS